MERARAVDHLEGILDRIEGTRLPVPVREVWVFGELALGLDPIDRLDVYLTKEVMLGGSPEAADRLEEEFGVKGVGTTVDASWARGHPEAIRANPNGYVAPEKCLAAHLLPAGAPIHLEVCNAGFESNVTQRLEAAAERDTFGELLDPRGVCLWLDGRRSEDALDRLREGAYVFPPLEDALEMLGLDPDTAAAAAGELRAWRSSLEGRSVRGDVV